MGDNPIFFERLDTSADVGDYLENGALLLAATPQLATDWKRRLVAEGSVTETPNICNWPHWLNELVDRWPDMPVPLNALQELALWQQVIGSDMAGRLSAAALRGMARHAAAAYALVRDYRIEPDDLAISGEEGEAFHRWLGRFERLCEAHGRMAEADIGRRLLPLIGHGPAEIILDGFERLTPLQQALLRQFERGGSRISVLGHAEAAPGITLSRLPDVESEYRHAAAVLRGLLERNAGQRIAIVTAGAPADAAMLRRRLDEALFPDGSPQLPAAGQAVSMAGEPLAGMPLVRQLLNLLALAGNGGAPFVDLSRLLFSPVLGGFEAERRGRAQLDAWLRENRRHYLSFSALLATEQLQALPALSAILGALQAWSRAPRRAFAWVKAVHELLRGCGCLQIERSLSAIEVRQLNSFRDTLASLVAIDAVAGDIDWGTFLLLLRERLSATPFALPARYPQVSVLPLAAIPGLRFDAVIAIGFDEDALPMPAEAQPLLPPALARKYRLPLATPELAFATSGFLWGQLRLAAPKLLVSYARQKEERQLAVSPLLANLPEQQEALLAAGQEPARMQIPMRIELQSFDDAPAVPLGGSEQVRGGAAIIKNQSACPFRAFATHRLGLTPLGETEPGVDAATKGALVHLALEEIWQRLGSQQALLALDEAAVGALIDTAVACAMQRCRTIMAESAKGYEEARLRQLLGEWLEIERQRPAFTVLAREREFRLRLPAAGDGRLPVRLQADRIDRDEAGRTILIDYKAGKRQSPGRWQGERMAEPQLPLYAVAAGLGGQDAACFARLRSGDMGFEGLSGEDTGIKGVSPFKGGEEAGDWPALLAFWRMRLDALAAEFVEGVSQVTPRDARACDHCGLEAVCRIDEMGFDADADLEEGEE